MGITLVGVAWRVGCCAARYNKATMVCCARQARCRLWILPALLALLPLLVTGCAEPEAARRPRGDVVLRSPSCHCRFPYPAAWYFQPANGDPSRPLLGITSYDASSADHVPIPTTFANIGVDWQSDPLGQLYLAATTRHFSPWPGHRLTVSGWPATSYAHWTAPPAQGGVYVEHVYFFVPWYQRDYDLWFQAANPPSHDIAPLHRVFAHLLRTLTIVPPNAVP